MLIGLRHSSRVTPLLPRSEATSRKTSARGRADLGRKLGAAEVQARACTLARQHTDR